MSVQFRDLIAAASSSLARDHGFRAHGGRSFTREDELIRSARFAPGASLAGSFQFEVVCDLGISGLSSISSKSSEWMVRCSVSHVPRDDGLPRSGFELTGAPEDEVVVQDVAKICKVVFDRFLLRHETADDMFLWVRDNALQFLDSPQVDNDFKRFRLSPWNIVPRLELAGVYAAYLGRSEDAERLRDAAIQYARTHGLRYAIPTVSANIAAAAQVAAGPAGGPAGDGIPSD